MKKKRGRRKKKKKRATGEHLHLISAFADAYDEADGEEGVVPHS